MIFKSKQSHKAFFTIGKNTKRCINWLYETEDKEEIKFLEANSNFIEYKEKVEKKVVINKDIEKKIKDMKKKEKKEDKKEVDKTKEFIDKNWG